jgi:predicted transcriptional regulator
VPIVIDPSKDGLEKVLRDYQIEALGHIWTHDEGGLTSREVYEAVNERLDGGRSVSRASIINFLNAMCDEGVLDFEEETCKGGMRRRYSKGMDEAAFKTYVASTVIGSLMRDFPEQTVEAIKSSLDAGALKRLHD